MLATPDGAAPAARGRCSMRAPAPARRLRPRPVVADDRRRAAGTDTPQPARPRSRRALRPPGPRRRGATGPAALRAPGDAWRGGSRSQVGVAPARGVGLADAP